MCVCLKGSRRFPPHLVSGGLVGCHVTLQLRAVAEGVGTQRAGEALVVLLMTVFDVFLQRRQTFIAAVTVRTCEQLGEVVGNAGRQLCTHREGSKVREWRLVGVMTKLQPLTVLTVVLRDGLRRAQSRNLFWGFWVNNGGVAALKVLSNGYRVTVVLHFTFQIELIEL